MKRFLKYIILSAAAFALASCSAAPEDDPVAAGRGDVTFVLQTPDMAPKTKLYTGDPGDDSIGLDVETIDNYIGSLDLYVFNTSGTLVWSSHVFSNDYEEISLAYHDLGTWSGAEYGLYDVIAVANLDKSPSGTNYTKITSRSALNNMLVCFGTDLSSCGTYVTASGTKLCESHAFSVFSEDGTGDFTPGTYHFPSQFVMVSPLRRIAVSSAAMSVTLSLERIVSKIVIKDITFDDGDTAPYNYWESGSGEFPMDLVSFTRSVKLLQGNSPATGYGNLGASYQTFLNNANNLDMYDLGCPLYLWNTDPYGDSDEYGEKQILRGHFIWFESLTGSGWSSWYNWQFITYYGDQTIEKPYDQDNVFTAYVLPNANTDEIMQTRIYIMTDPIEGDDTYFYYPIIIPNIGRNELYEISNVVITGTIGASNPWTKPLNPSGPIGISYTMTVRNWATGAVKSIKTVGSRGSVDSSGNVTY